MICACKIIYFLNYKLLMDKNQVQKKEVKEAINE
jgi:hypothetical protein